MWPYIAQGARPLLSFFGGIVVDLLDAEDELRMVLPQLASFFLLLVPSSGCSC